MHKRGNLDLQSPPVFFALQHGRITWIDEIRINICFGKIEKCRQAGESSTFGLGFAAVGDLVHEIQDVINGQIVNVTIMNWQQNLSLTNEWDLTVFFFRMDLMIVEPDFSCF